MALPLVVVVACVVLYKFIAGCGDGGALGTGPTVIFMSPDNNSTGIPINWRITATFSTEMDPSTITATTFKVAAPGGIPLIATPVTGTVTTVVTGGMSTAIFTPTVNFAPNTTYTATITTAVRDLAGNALANEFTWSFTTGATADITPLTVRSVLPADAADDVPINYQIAATFSEPLDPLTLTTETFTVAGPGGTRVTGTIAYVLAGDISTAVFTPSSYLAPLTTYIATFTTGLKDLAGNALASSFVWSFTTGLTSKETVPKVIFTDPADGASNEFTSTLILANFDEEMDPLTITAATFKVTGPGGAPVTGTAVYDIASNAALFTPLANLAPNTIYTATITTGARDIENIAMAADHIWSFTTGAGPCSDPPTVESTNPADAAADVPLNKAINAHFSEAVNPLTVTTLTFKVTGPGLTPVTGVITYDTVNHIATFTPSSNLAPSTVFTATITTGVRCLYGVAMASDFVWTFTTGTGEALAPVNLGTAGLFAVLAGTGVASTAATALTGDLGVSPGNTLTGFPPGTVNGTIHLADAAAALAKAALTTAYNDAAGRLLPAALPANLSGLTIPPGLYKNASSVSITGGNVNLDAQGDAAAVFIFQIGSTLTTGTDTQVILINGAKARNVFWQVGTSATLGTTSVFRGNILAQDSITVNNSAGMTGGALALTGAVTLEANDITIPPP